jgi:hypothetical protein
VIGQAEVGRLAADWLAWSLQVGAAPARVVCVGSTAGDDSPEALSPQSLGMALGRLWPGATVDLAVHDDPIGATLHRLATREGAIDAEDGRLELLDLSRRPGRAHRAVYRWASLAVLAGAVALFGVAWKGFSGATSAAEARKQLRDKITTDVKAIVAPKDEIQKARLEASPHAYLEEQVNRKRQALAPATGVEPAKPILQEIETLSLVLGSAGDGVKLDQLSLLNSNVSLYAIVPDTATGEALADSLASVAGTHVEWRPPDFNTPRSGGAAAGGRKSLTLFGRWKSDAPAAPAGGGK